MFNITKSLRLKDRIFGDGGCTLYISEYSNVDSVEVDVDNKYVSNITMKSTNKFYEFKLPRNNISWSNNIDISVSNACYLYKPSISFKVPGLTVDTLGLYDFLTRKSVIVIVKTMANMYWVLGKDNGIDMESGSNFSLGLGGTDLIGSTYNLTGRERSRIYEIDPLLVTDLIDIITTDHMFMLEITTLSTNTIFTIPHTTGIHDYIVDWGDGTSSVVTSSGDTNRIHTYSSIGVYTLSIFGTCETFYLPNNQCRQTITKVLSWGNVGLTTISFYLCINLNSIPTDTYHGLNRMTSFYLGFVNCFNLTSIPSGIFDYCKNVTTFESTFTACDISSIPVGLFNNCTSVTSFKHTFFTTPITSIPVGLFDNNLLVNTFQNTFDDCNLCTSIPVGLFDNNLLVNTFQETFNNCISLTGDAPELWVSHPTAIGTNCFFNDTGLTNYSSIPIDWK